MKHWHDKLWDLLNTSLEEEAKRYPYRFWAILFFVAWVFTMGIFTNSLTVLNQLERQRIYETIEEQNSLIVQVNSKVDDHYHKKSFLKGHTGRAVYGD